MGGKAPVKLIVSLGCQTIPLSTRAHLPSPFALYQDGRAGPA
jgi:hypothetical protein